MSLLRRSETRVCRNGRCGNAGKVQSLEQGSRLILPRQITPTKQKTLSQTHGISSEPPDPEATTRTMANGGTFLRLAFYTVTTRQSVPHRSISRRMSSISQFEVAQVPCLVCFNMDLLDLRRLSASRSQIALISSLIITGELLVAATTVSHPNDFKLITYII